MKSWTAHVAPDRAPVLVREGFSWGALLFGPVWLAAKGAWSMAGLVLAFELILLTSAPHWSLAVAAFLLGLFGQDLRRISLGWGGYSLDHVVAATSADGAFARLMARRPDLIERAAR